MSHGIHKRKVANRFYFLLAAIALTAFAGWLCFPPARAEEPQTANGEEAAEADDLRNRFAIEREARERIERGLNKIVSCEFKETPLRDVAEYLAKEIDANVIVGVGTFIEDTEISPDLAITGKFHNVSIRSLLNMILEKRKLAWHIKHESLVIDTPYIAEREMRREIYDVSDLVGDGPDETSLREFVSIIESGPYCNWESQGGDGVIKPYRMRGAALVIASNTKYAHDEIEDLLARLRHLQTQCAIDNKTKPEADWKKRIEQIVQALDADAAFGPLPENLPDRTEFGVVCPLFRRDLPEVAPGIRAATSDERILPVFKRDQILERLQRSVSCEFNEITLDELKPWLADELQANVYIDWPELKDCGVDPKRTFSANMRGISLQSLLELVLREVDRELDWTIEGDSLVVTSNAKVESELFTIVYDVADLTFMGNAGSRPLGMGLGGGWAVYDYSYGYYYDSDYDFDSLIEVMTHTVHPESWDELGGPGSVDSFDAEGMQVLVVAQTLRIHQKIERLFADLRAKREIAKRGQPLLRELEQLKKSRLFPDDEEAERTAIDSQARKSAIEANWEEIMELIQSTIDPRSDQLADPKQSTPDDDPFAEPPTEDPFDTPEAELDPFAAPEPDAKANRPQPQAMLAAAVKRREAEANVRKQLNRKVDCEFVEAPLIDIVDWFKKELKINIALDRRELENLGIDSSPPTTRRCKNITARSALTLILRDLELDWMIDGDVLLITGPQVIESNPIAGVHDVTDLVILPDVIGAGGVDFDTLIELITTMVAPETWPEVGGPGSISGLTTNGKHFLIFPQTQRVHEQTADFLTDLREAAFGGGRPEALAEMPLLRKPRREPVTYREHQRAAERHILRQLDNGIKWEFSETPLEEVLKIVSAELKIPADIDRRELEALGIDSHTRVTYKLEGILARGALDLMLRDLELTWHIDCETLLVTSPNVVEMNPQTRVYNVRDLATLKPEPWHELDDFIRVVVGSIPEIGWVDPSPRQCFSGLMIQETPLLVVTGERTLHEHIAQLFTEMREVMQHRRDLRNPPKGRPGITKWGEPETRKMRDAEQHILKSLEGNFRCDFEEEPLENVASYFEDFLGVVVRLDRRELESVGIDSGTPVTRQLENVSARAALNAILNDFELTWTIENDVLLITSPQKAETNVSTRVYDATDFLQPKANRESAKPTENDLETLIATIKKMAHRKSWDSDEGWGRIGGYIVDDVPLLIVTHKLAVHLRLQKIFETEEAEAFGAVEMLEDPFGAPNRNGDPLKPQALLAAAIERRKAEANVLKQLNRKVDCDFAEKPLEDVVEWFKKELKINIALDRRELKAYGIDGSTPVTRRCNNITARSALTLMLRDLKLDWVIDGDALLVCGPGCRERALFTGVHDVTDLMNLPERQNAAEVDFDSLIAVITSHVDPETWDELGGPGSIVGVTANGKHFLVFSYYPGLHEEIDELLNDIREAAFGKPAAPPVEPTYRDRLRAAGANINKRLKTVVDWEFFEAPLDDVVAVISDKLKIPIELDRRELENLGIDAHLPVTRKFRQVSARTALELILRDLELTWRVDCETLTITSLQFVETDLTTRIYKVGDLVKIDPERQDALSDPTDDLLEIIVQVITPETWDSEGGPGSISGSTIQGMPLLIVSQPEIIHERIAQLLAEMREAVRKRQAQRNPQAEKLQPAANGQPNPQDKYAAERRILKALESDFKCDFDGAPLHAVCDHFGKTLNVPIFLDRRELENEGIDSETPVTCQLENVSARAALNTILNDLELTWTIENDALLITSHQKVETTMTARVYDATDLLKPAANEGDGNAPAANDLEALIATIQKTVHPKSWEEQGGPACIRGYVADGVPLLIVTQKLSVHVQLQKLFKTVEANAEDAQKERQADEPAAPNPAEQGNRLETGHPLGLTPADRRDAARRANEFSIALYRELAGREPKQNIVVSGHAVRNAAALLSFGANDAARAELCERLGLPQSRERAAAELLYLQPLVSPFPESKRIHQRNALWVDDSIAVDADFIDFARALQNVSVETIDFQERQRTLEAVRLWRKAESPRPVQGGIHWPASSPSDRAVFVAGFDYWRYRSSYRGKDERDQKTGLPLADFHPAEEQTVQVPTDTIRLSASRSSQPDLGLDVVELRGHGNDLSLVVFFPMKTSAVADPLDRLEEALSHEFLERQLRALKPTDMIFRLPYAALSSSFAIDWNVERADSPETGEPAAFSKISANVKRLPPIAHHATVELGAADRIERNYNTGMLFGFNGYPAPIDANRPFLFLLRDRNTGCILLMGRVVDPRS